MASVQTKDYIVQLIKEEILSGVMKPGEELAQEALAERLGVSRMPIREALQNLVQEGFAVRLPNRHIQAVVLSAQQIHDVFHVIAAMAAENTILVAKKEQMLADYEDRMAWAKKMVVNIAKAGYFSSDRTIAEYNRDIWHL